MTGENEASKTSTTSAKGLQRNSEKENGQPQHSYYPGTVATGTQNEGKLSWCSSLGNFIGYVFYVPTFKKVLKGFKSPLGEEDVPLRPEQCTSKFLVVKAQNEWDKAVEELNLSTVSTDEVSPYRVVLKVIWRLHRSDLLVGIILSIIQGLLSTVARPLLLREIILAIENEDGLSESELNSRGAALAAGISLCILVEGLLQAHVKQLLSIQLGSRFLSWTMALIHKKSLRVSEEALSKSELVENSIIGNDLVRIYEDWRWMCLLPFIITALIGGVIILGFTLKLSSLVGIGVMAAIVGMNFTLARTIKSVEVKDYKRGDERLAIMKELLEGIKAIKMTAWEYPFQEILSKVRKEETDLIRHFRTLQVSSINLGRSSPALAACFTIITLVAINESDVTAANLFVAMSAFLALRLPLIGIPTQTVLLANTVVSFNRIGSYLLLDDADRVDKLPENSKYGVVMNNVTLSYESVKSLSTGAIADKTDSKHGVPDSHSSSDDASVSITVNPSVFQLRDITIRVPRKGMVAVVGKVASGKSSLLNGIIGSLKCVQGSIQTRESVSFVPQKPFVMSGSLRDNVTMGKNFDKTTYEWAVKTADLSIDFQNMKYGDMTEIGERGQTVSGGQQQRLAIARAIYSNPQLLILDDPLSAVDPQVAQTIFGNLKSSFKDQNRDCSLLMSLNQYYFLPHFDYIYVLSNGAIAEEGSYQELIVKEDGILKGMVEMTDSSSMDQTPESAEKKERADHNESNEEKAKELVDVDLKPTAEEASEGVQDIEKEEDTNNVTKREEATVVPTDEGNVLVKKDFASTGAVSSFILRRYLGAMGPTSVPISILLGALAYGILALNDALVYASLPEQTDADKMSKLAFIYMGLSLAHVLGVQFLSLHNCNASVRASRALHDECINYLLHAPITWFESNPSGRILGRFSGDLSNVDRQLGFIFDDCFQFFFMLLALSAVVCSIVPYLFPVIVLGTCLFAFEVVALDRSNREVKRLANQSLAPVLTNISETVSARNLIQVMNLGSFFSARQEAFVDQFVKNQHFSGTLINWSIMMTGLISFLLAFPASMVVVFLRDTIDASEAGLALTYSFLIPYFLGILAIVLPIGFAALTSLERVLEYYKLPQEPNWHEEVDKDLCPQLSKRGKRCTVPKESMKMWPSKGEIEFQEASLVYRPGLPPAIDRLSVRFEGGSRIAIIGRTGAGKSSLTLLLFRVYEASTGRVLVDGQDIAKVGLQLLRRSIASIPQHPLLLRGSIRKNLDPFGLYSNEQLRKVMVKVGLDVSLLDDEHGKTPEGEGEQPEETKNAAFTLSIGQRQLISLARVLLRDSVKIVVMDEPTSNIDQETDQNIQRAVRSELGSATVITIAHRLGTVIDCDKILVLEKGKMVEFDSGVALLQDKTSHLYDIVHSMGEDAAASLLQKAKSARVIA